MSAEVIAPVAVAVAKIAMPNDSNYNAPGRAPSVWPAPLVLDPVLR